MEIGMFQTPLMRPSRTAREVFSWAVDQAVVADQAGLAEYWVGEHATQSWECIPNPELVIAAAALQTEQIMLCPGAHLPPYHHPATLAVQVAWLSQILEGRYMLGVGAGAYPADAYLRGLADMSENHKMLLESLDIMDRIWVGKPFLHEGSYWKAGFPEVDGDHPFRDISLYGGRVQMALAGLSPDSPSIRFAGQRGYLPLSIYSGDQFVRNHWDIYSRAAEEAGHPADRKLHRVVRDVFVAETDAEARRAAIDGGMGRAWREYLLPIYKRFGIFDSLIDDPDIDPDSIGVEWLADNVWIVGSPETVVEKFQAAFERSGVWGTTLVYGHDYIDEPERWNESLRLLATEVAPRLRDKELVR